MFTRERLRWRKQAAGAHPSLFSLVGSLETEAARNLVQIYKQHLDEALEGLPTKSDFKSWMLKGELEHCILYDFEDREKLVFRVVGEEIKARFGNNLAGRSYFEFVAPERRASALQAFRHCADTPCAMHVKMRQAFENGRRALCEVVGVPLAEDAGEKQARYLLFINKLVDEGDIRYPDRGMLQHTEILSRRFADIGFGCPDGFHDLVRR